MAFWNFSEESGVHLHDVHNLVYPENELHFFFFFFRYEVKIEEMTKKLQRLEEKHIFDRSTLDHSATELQATVHELTEKLRKSEESNKNLQIYIDHLKKSYHNVFGEKTQTTPSLSHSKSVDK